MNQHLQALERANFVRLTRVDLKTAIKAHEVMVAEVLLGEIPDWLEAMLLEELCNAILRYGRTRYQRLMQDTHTGAGATVGGLTERKRTELAEHLAEWEAGVASRRRARARRHRTRAAQGVAS